MNSPSVVETELLAEDWATLRDALRAVGRDSKAHLGWLLEQGLDGFIHDEAEWKALEARPDEASQARRQELKRREAEAFLVSMRASTIAAEIEMHGLADRVRVLADEMEGHRRVMWPLRRENDALEAHLRGSGNAAQREQPPAAGSAGPALLGWLKKRVAMGRNRRE